MAMKTIHLIISVSTLLLSLFRICSGHSFILVPKGDFKSFNKAECRQGGPSHAPDDNCKGPCFRKENWQYDKDEETTTYERGEVVDMVWARNNHRGGFVRFALVPESERMNETAHDSFAFRYACYDSDKHECTFDTSKEKRCGTDKYIQQTKVEIPTSLADGIYILGWAWFGGISFERKSLFGDYWSCSRVRIRGGLLTESYTPVFNPGENLKLDDPKNPTCMSSTGRLRDCVREPCLGRPVLRRVPDKFAKGEKPAPILHSWTDKTSKGAPPMKTNPPNPEEARSSPSPTPVAYVSGLRLVDVDTKEVLARRFFRRIYIPKRVKRLSFIAKVRGDVESVTFYINDKFVRVEREKPFSAFGDTLGKLYGWPNPVYNKLIKVRVVATDSSGEKHRKTFRMYLKKAQKPERE